MNATSRNPLIVSAAPLFRATGGSALCRLLGLSLSQIVEAFDFSALDETSGAVAPKRRRVPPAYQMRTAAWEIVCSHRWRGCSRVILLGREVSRAFGLRPADPYLRWIEWGYWEGRAVAVLPHPRGASVWWRDASNLRRGQRFMREAAGLPIGDPQGALEIGVVED